MSRRAFVVGFCLGVVGAVAPSCGGGSNDPSGGSQFCLEYASAYCDYAIRCGSVANGARSDCVTYVQGFLCGATAASTARGYQTFDKAKAQTLLTSIANAKCDASASSVILGTSDLFAPAVGSGGACFVTADCKSTAEACGGSSSCGRTCTVTGGQGQPCPRSGTSCKTGLRCDSATNTCALPGGAGADCVPFSSGQCDSTTVCDSATSKCAALPTAGQACRTSSPRCAPTAWCSSNVCQPKLGADAGCPSFDACEATLFCDSSLAPDACQVRRAEGGACTSEAQCQAGLKCISQLCAPPKAEGQTCTSSSVCADGLTCDSILKVCATRVAGLKAGESCTESTRSCSFELDCKGRAANPDGGVGTSGMCKLPAVGDSCTSSFSSDCPYQSLCNLAPDGGAGTCVAATTGAKCSGSSSHCLTTDFCENGVCAARKMAGSPCSSSTACANPLQCVGAADGGTCKAPGDVGAACVETTSGGSTGCLFPLGCEAGACKHAGAQGEACLSNSFCLKGACVLDGGVKPFCGAQRAEGGSCTSGGDCVSGRCVNRTCDAVCP